MKSHPPRANAIPRAPTVPQPVVTKAPALVRNPIRSGVPFLAYDPDSSFASNLERLKSFCTLQRDYKDAHLVAEPLVRGLYARADSDPHLIIKDWKSGQGTSLYRTVLLGCLAASRVHEATSLFWGGALDRQESSEVRRTALHLLREIGDATPNPDAMRQLLFDPDESVLLFTLSLPAAHWDNRTVERAEALFNTSTNIHLKLASLSAMATVAPEAIQGRLMAIASQTNSSREDPFSEVSLVKRLAVSRMALSSPEEVQLVVQIATNPAEDPGVREKAILRMGQSDSTSVEETLKRMLASTGDDNALVLRAITDALLRNPKPKTLRLITEKIATLQDPHVRKLLQARIEKANP